MLLRKIFNIMRVDRYAFYAESLTTTATPNVDGQGASYRKISKILTFSLIISSFFDFAWHGKEKHFIARSF
jgi:hypothetical protein